VPECLGARLVQRCVQTGLSATDIWRSPRRESGELLGLGPPGRRRPDAGENQPASVVRSGHPDRVDPGDVGKQPIDPAVLDTHGDEFVF
jgi:hypothetical protein